MAEEVEVEVAEPLIHHLLQKTVPLWFVAVLVLMVDGLLLREEVEQAEVPEQAAQTDLGTLAFLQQGLAFCCPCLSLLPRNLLRSSYRKAR